MIPVPRSPPLLLRADALLRGRRHQPDDQAEHRQVQQHLHRHQHFIPLVVATMSPNPTVANTVTVKYSAVVWSSGTGERAGLASEFDR